MCVVLERLGVESGEGGVEEEVGERRDEGVGGWVMGGLNEVGVVV